MQNEARRGRMRYASASRRRDAQLSEINAWMRMHTERMRASMGEIRAIIRTLTEMQADIVRIDAGE